MTKRKMSTAAMESLLGDERVRRTINEDEPRFAAVDIVACLADSQPPGEAWEDLKHREPMLATLVEAIEFPDGLGTSEVADAVDLFGVMRLIQAIPSSKAERLKHWLAESAVERLQEQHNPELAITRTRRLYRQKGHSRRWVDSRLRAISVRQGLVGEWNRRGVRDSEAYRTLTNDIMREAFGMDVEAYRRYKNLQRSSQSLREHMTDLELELVSLGETAAATLHAERDSFGFEQIHDDVLEAGRIVRHAREEIERHGGRNVVSR